jgi:hypothetical protein
MFKYYLLKRRFLKGYRRQQFRLYGIELWDDK